ncbi:MAG: biopolymer transporter ExbD [Elusimicrobia bacterium]|nr:biopolymer transporter ExbD [Elusimicrobiota bacterium]
MFDRFKKVESGGELFANMAPMADVVFLLLIFFMLTSAFVLEPGIDVDLPRAVTAEEQIRQKHVLTITRDRTLLLDQDVVSFGTLKRVLEDTFLDEQTKLLIVRADENVPHGLVVRVLDISRQAGVTKLAIATEKIKNQ